MTMPEDEDKYGRFERYFDIDIKTIEEAALGGSGADLSNYYTKAQTYSKTEVDALIDGVSGGDLSNYYTKTETNSLLSSKADATALTNYIPLSQKDANNGVPGLDNNGRVAPERLGANATASSFLRGDKTWQVLDKTTVGLTNVDNTADLNKPVSTATQTALNGKEATITAGTTAQYWRGDKSWQTLNKTAVGLANVDNTSDANKPVSSATQTALNLKADIAGTPRYLIFSTTWPSRPADSRMTFWIGGSSSTDTPTGAVTGDVWIPAS